MTDSDRDTPDRLRAEAELLRETTRAEVKRSLVRWCVRQAIGVAVVAWLAHTYGAAMWWLLVPMGLLALASLALMLRLRRIADRGAERVIERLER
jgi:fatty acid desaturase